MRDNRPDNSTSTDPSYSDASFSASSCSGRSYSPAHGFSEPEPVKANRAMPAAAIAVLCLVCLLLAAALGAVLTLLITDRKNTEETETSEAAVQAVPLADGASGEPSGEMREPLFLSAASDEPSHDMSADDIYSLASAQVVSVRSSLSIYSDYTPTVGSGFFLTDTGYILTGYSVAENAFTAGYTLTVTVPSGTEYEAELIGVEPSLDLAVLKINAEGLSAATLGDSYTLQDGQTLYAASRPDPTVCSLSVGTVRSLDSGITLSVSTDAMDTGGPIYNRFGQVVGIVSSGQSSRYVVGLPMADALTAANEIIANGYVAGQSCMGITPATVSAIAAQYYNMTEGAYVYSVDAGSRAAAAGLHIGDIITAVGTSDITDANSLVSALRRYADNEPVPITIFRDQQTLRLTLPAP